MNPAATAPPANRNLGGLVTSVFDHWRAENIEFLVLRNYENIPQDIGNDLDLMVAPDQFARAEQLLLDTAREFGFLLHNRVEFLPVSLFFFHTDSLQQIQFDLFTDLKWRGFTFLAARPMLARRLDRGLFSVPHPADEAVNGVLTRQIYHGYIKEDYKPVIRAAVEKCPGEVEATFREMFGATIAARVTRTLQVTDWKAVEAETGGMRRQLVWRRLTRRPGATLRSLLNDFHRYLGRLLRPPGLTLVFLGPDGSGKSTVAARVSAALNYTFKPDKGLMVHWKPVVFFRRRRLNRPPTTNPHGGIPRGMIGSFLALGWHWLEFFLGALVQFLPVRFRNGLIVIDRFHYDFFVDPRRYRLRDKVPLARCLFKLLPSPDLVFLLDAPPEVLHARKAEVPIEETRRQREVFLELTRDLPNGNVITSDQPIENVVVEITRRVLLHLAKRQAQRTGK